MRLLLALALMWAQMTLAQEQSLLVGSLGVRFLNSPAAEGAEPLGTVLYLPGYGDRFSNHAPLFKQWNQAGLNVVSFDYPSHGGTKGAYIWDDLDWYGLPGLAELASRVLDASGADPQKPLILAGWSTGGLLAIRIAQMPRLRRLFPNLKALILFAPGVEVETCVSNAFCHITNDTLTHNPELQNRLIQPGSPLYRLQFAAQLLLNARAAWFKPIPADLPTLVFVAGEKEDKYVISRRVKDWIQYQNQVHSAKVMGIECPNARHELDNEPKEFGGEFVREQAARFARAVSSGSRWKLEFLDDPACRAL